MRVLSRHIQATPEQLQLIGDDRPGFKIIRGAAGSGKTTTALLRLRGLTESRLNRRRRLGRVAPVSVLVLTFNRTLEGYIAELARYATETHGGLDLEISTFGRWARRLVGDVNILGEGPRAPFLRRQIDGVAGPGQYDFFVDEIEYMLGRFRPDNLSDYITTRRTGRGRAPRVTIPKRETLLREVLPVYLKKKAERGVIDWNDLAVLAADTDPDPLYDIVIVDEAQDFSANQVRAILRHLHPKHSTTFVLDAVQRIYPRYFRWSEVGIRVRPEIVYKLTENHRNTAAIAAFARPLVAGLPSEDDGTLPDFDACPRPGDKPIVVAGRYAAQLEYMLDRIVRIVDLDKESVVLLKPRGGGWFNMARQVLRARGIRYVELARQSVWPSGPVNFALCTIHSAKGLEFDHVLLPGLNQEVTPHGPEAGDADLDRLRRMLGMAIGRARKSVMVGYKPGEESSLIGLLDRTTYKLVEV